MATPQGGWRAQPWLSLLVLPALVLVLGSDLRVESPVELERVVRVAPSKPEQPEGLTLAGQPEGAPAKSALVLRVGERLEIALRRPAVVSGLEIQADHAAQLVVHGSADRTTWTAISRVARVEPRGLRTRSLETTSEEAPWQWLRIEPVGQAAVAIGALRVLSPWIDLPCWVVAPLGAWSVWLLLVLRGARSGPVLGRWRRWDLPVTTLGLGLVVPFFTLPALAACSLAALLAWQLDGAHRSDDGSSERLWSSGALLALVVVATVQFGFVTRATGSLSGWELHGVAYDSLADHLLEGSTGVDRYAIRWEVFDVDGRPTMYFGPLPALLRVPANWLAPTLYGNWARLSCWAAALLSVTAAGLILRRPLRTNRWLTASGRRGVLALSMLAFGLGTPVAFAIAAAAIYHEATLWGLATGLFGLHFALELAHSRERPERAMLGLATAAGAAMLARATFGIPLYALLAVFGLAILYEYWRGGRSPARELARLALWTSPALAAGVFQLWLNHDRFGSITTFVDYGYLGYMATDSRSTEIFQQSGTFNLGRIPTSLANYFGFRSEALVARFPFVSVMRPFHLAPDLYQTIFKSTVVSLSVASTWLVVGALLGSGAAARRESTWPQRVVLAAVFVQTLLLLSFCIVSQRYAIDFLPFLWAGYACFVAGLGRRFGSRFAPALLGVAVATSVFVTTCSTLSWIPQSRLFTPQEYKDRVLETYREVSTALDAGPRP